MNRQVSLLSAGCLAFAAALPAPALMAQQPDEAPPPAVGVPDVAAPDGDASVAIAAVPKGRPTEISNWALAGVLWSDAHLVRKLATASARQSENSRRREKMALLAQDCDTLIESLESFGWKKIAAVQTARRVANEATELREDVPLSGVPPESGLSARVETETPAGLEDPGLDDELGPDLDADLDPLDRPFHLRRYRVDDYVDEIEAERLNTADAVEDGVEAALAANTDDVTSGFDIDGGSAVDAREVQTRSATLPYATESIYDVDSLHPNATYPEFIPGTEREVPGVDEGEFAAPTPSPAERIELDSEDELIQEATREPRPLPPSGITIDRYTDRAERFSEDADWVKFQLTANQQRWLMLRSAALSDEELAQQVNAAILQLKADAATAVASSDDPQLIGVLQEIAR